MDRFDEFSNSTDDTPSSRDFVSGGVPTDHGEPFAAKCEKDERSLATKRESRKRAKRQGRRAQKKKDGLLEKALALLAGLATFCLLLGFPAVAWQFSRFGVPLDLAPDRTFLIAGVPPTLAFIAGEVLSRRVPKIESTDAERPLQMLFHMGAFALPIIFLWPVVALNFTAVYAACGLVIGGWVRAALDFGNSARALDACVCAVLVTAAQLWSYRSKFASKSKALAGIAALVAMAPMFLVLYGASSPPWHYWALAGSVIAVPATAMLGLALTSWWTKRASVAALTLQPVPSAAWLTLMPMVLTTFGTIVLGTGMAIAVRAALVVLGALEPSAPVELWIAYGLLAGLLFAYSTAATMAALLDGQQRASSWRLWRSSNPGARLMRWAHLVFVLALLVVHALGVFSYLPRTLLGGRPPCVAGTTLRPVPGAKLLPKSKRGAEREWAFANLCVLVLTNEDVVLCSANEPPASCVALKRADVPTLRTSSL